MSEELIEEIAKKFKITEKDLIEKDIILHNILTHLSNNKYFLENYLFKGGTCLVKAFLGYVRFSEDLDFTWTNQKVYEGKSGSQIEKYIANEIDMLGDLFVDIASKYNLDFKFDKINPHYFQFGGGGKMLTMCMWYDSKILKIESMIKIQINFLEQICYSTESHDLQSLTSGDDELKFLYSAESEYFNTVKFSTYALREILCEKIRAILTRKGAKARDFLDIYQVCKKFEIDLSEIIDNSILKLKFSLGMYKKYCDNMTEKLKLLESGDLFAWGSERRLLLQNVDDVDFNSFVKKLENFLKESVLKLTDRNVLSEITILCSNCLNKFYLSNAKRERFDQIDLSSEKCLQCHKTDTLQAFPM